jgi:small subunit ribosomal protein S5
MIQRRERSRDSGSGEPAPFDERVVQVNRVAKVTKGAKRFSFAALTVVGDGKGRVGIGYGKASEVPAAIQKGMEVARKAMITVPMAGQTVVHEVIGEHSGSRVLIKPAAPGTGVIAGGAVRLLLEAAGIKDALAKSLGSPTPLNVAKAALVALTKLRRPDEVAQLRGKRPEEVTPPGLLAAYRSTESLRARS